MIVKIIQDLGKRMEKMQEVYQGPRRTKEQTEMNNAITKMKNTLGGINNE